MGRHTSRNSCRICTAPKNGNCSQRSLNWSSSVICVCDMNTAVADCPSDDPDHPNDWQERERERYRLRLGLRGTLLDDWFFGVRLETSASARSSNVTFGADTSTSSPGGGGPFAKGGRRHLRRPGVWRLQRLPRLYVYRRPNAEPVRQDADGVGRRHQPGRFGRAVETYITIGGGDSCSSLLQQGWESRCSAPPPEPFVKIDVFANFGQFVYDDTNPENPIGTRPTTTQPIGGETQQYPDMPMHSCSAGRSERSLISRTSFTSSLRQPSTTTPATATRLTSISLAISGGKSNRYQQSFGFRHPCRDRLESWENSNAHLRGFCDELRR